MDLKDFLIKFLILINLYRMNRLLIILTFFLLSNPIFTQERTPIKILFVGNSFTFFWNMPELVSAMAESQGVSINSISINCKWK